MMQGDRHLVALIKSAKAVPCLKIFKHLDTPHTCCYSGSTNMLPAVKRSDRACSQGATAYALLDSLITTRP